ncbi:MAG: periplasmic chaperone for outer membrane proteins SurA [Candidatus Nitrotoga sp. SPKER]|nr:MAG: periplasmic chaperone for outer membrane proteins SurA [Candidatus Nitrotoga sp. SPKER]
MLHIKLMLAILLSLACTANISAAGLQKVSGTTKKIKTQSQTKPSAAPATDVLAPVTAKKLPSQNQTLPPVVDLQTPDTTKPITVPTGPVLIDQIVAVVNNDAITRYELEDRLGIVERQLKKQGTALPDIDMLKKQLLERMITEMLQVQFAKETGIRIDDIQLDKTMQRIAKENKFPSLAEFRAQLEKENVDFKKFREEIRGEIIYARLREREVDSKLVISDGEVDNYLNNQAKLDKGEEFHLAHILIVVPEQASADKIQSTRQRADQALAQLRGGAEFAQVAAGFSDAKDALEGGNLGWRSADRTPAIFLGVLKKMAPGEISPVFRSPNGFHILKLLEKRNKENSVVITQTEARHILIKTSELVSENEAKSRLLIIKQRIEKGADFTKQAKLYSEDGSAAKGGDLGWISPGDTVPEFEAAMNQLEIGQMSGAVQSTFGWHLIQVLDRRNTDVSVKEKKKQAQMAIRAEKSDAAYQDWLRQLRDGATIEYRLEQTL